MPPSVKPTTAREWGAVVPQWVGIVGMVFLITFWAATGMLSAVLVSACLALIGVGQGAEAIALLKKQDISPQEQPDGA
jgi:hypothetical protein